MGRNAQRRRAQRDARREASGREVRSSLAERAGARIQSMIKTAIGSDQVPTNTATVSKSKANVPALLSAMAMWGAVR